MGRLFLLLYKYKAVLVFVTLEIICSWMIVSNNLIISASFFNSSNKAIASTISKTNTVQNYFGLRHKNNLLIEENARLQQELNSIKKKIYKAGINTVNDNEVINQYGYEHASVVNNSTRWFNNFITIDKGTNNGVQPNMGVVNQNGLVGKVQSVSKHYAVVASLLHNEVMVSSKIKRTGTICTTNWPGKNPKIANLKYVPRHVELQIGDTIVTSGFNAIFPENILIGTIVEKHLGDNQTFYDIKVGLINDFSSLSHVYVIKNKLVEEKDSLESINIILHDDQ